MFLCPYEFVIVDGLTEDIVLGKDFLRTYEASMYLDLNTLKLMKKQYYKMFDPTPRDIYRQCEIRTSHIQENTPDVEAKESTNKVITTNNIVIEPRTKRINSKYFTSFPRKAFPSKRRITQTEYSHS